MTPAYPPAGFLPPFLPPWGYPVPPLGGVRPGLYPEVPTLNMPAGVGQDGQRGELSCQPVTGGVSAGPQLPGVDQADQCTDKVDRGGLLRMLDANVREVRVDVYPEPEKGGVELVVPPRASNVNMREVRAAVNPEPKKGGVELVIPPRASNVNMREVRADVNPEQEKGGVELVIPPRASNVNMREVRADVNPEPEKGGVEVEVVYEDVEEIPKTGSSVEQVCGDQSDHVKQDAELDKYDDCTPKRSYRKTPFPLPSSSASGRSSPVFEVRI